LIIDSVDKARRRDAFPEGKIDKGGATFSTLPMMWRSHRSGNALNVTFL
jgi:hypothetical protein